MICPYCRNEKMDAATCPNCGLGEKEAVLKAADLYWTEGRQGLAVDYYGRYLALEPGDFEVACKNASYLCAMARERRDPHLFEKADRQISQILEGHWDWQPGHQSRVDLYFCFGKLDSLLAQYEKIAREDPARAATCAEMMNLIRLVARFKEEKPPAPEGLVDELDLSAFLESFWPLLLALGTYFALTVLLPSPQTSDESMAGKVAFFRESFGILIILGAGLFGIWRFQKFNKVDKPKKPKGPRPTLEP